jgi:hypothetical protein
MDLLALPAGAGIDEEHVAQSAPLVRALVTERLEKIWRVCEPHIEVPLGEDGVPLYKADPRFIEAGIRVIDRLARLYRLDNPQVGANEPATASLEGLREDVRAQVKALEARMNGS